MNPYISAPKNLLYFSLLPPYQKPFVCCSDKKVSFLMSHKSLLIFLSRQFFQHQFFHFFQ